jgi:hypothetical protein
VTGRLLEKLTVALLVKFPTFKYNILLFVVLNNIQQFTLLLSEDRGYIYIAGMTYECLVVIIAITSSTECPV